MPTTFSDARIRVFPSSNADNKSPFKLNSEKNLSGLARSHVRNKVLSGWNLPNGISISSNKATLSIGSCLISGYKVELIQATEVADLSGYTKTNTKYWTYFKLNRDSGGDTNLKGVASGSIYSGLEWDIVENISTLSGSEYLVIGYLYKVGTTWTYYPLNKSKTALRAQDIYIEGSIKGDAYQGRGADTTAISNQNPTDESTENPYATILNPSTTLDEYLANMIISDGQFN